jgi:hypothetical protein
MGEMIALLVIAIIGAAPIAIAIFDWWVARYEPMCQCPPKEVCCVGKEEDCE